MKEDVYLIFYISKYGNYMDKLINLYTNFGKGRTQQGFSHVEICFKKPEHNKDLVIFSSSLPDKGTRWKTITYNENHWVEININAILNKDLSIHDIKKRIKNELNKDYDLAGVFFHEFLYLDYQDKSKWWCSEIIAELIGIKIKDDPNVFYNLVNNMLKEEEKII